MLIETKIIIVRLHLLISQRVYYYARQEINCPPVKLYQHTCHQFPTAGLDDRSTQAEL